MMINKNIIAFTLCLTAFTVKAHDETNEHNVNMLTEIEETVITKVATAVAQDSITTVDNAIESAHHHNLSLQDAQILIQQLLSNLANSVTFTINGTTYTIQAAQNKVYGLENSDDSLAYQDDNILLEISEDTEFETLFYVISSQDAVSLLQSCANSLVNGSAFQLNGIIYIVQNESQDNSDDTTASDENDTISSDDTQSETDSNDDSVVADETVLTDDTVTDEVVTSDEIISDDSQSDEAMNDNNSMDSNN